MADKLALVTGATSGFGKACAEKFAQEGYDVIITGRRQERLQELRERLQKDFGVEVLTADFDIRDFKACRAFVEGLSGKWRKIDVLVNNAGLALGLVPIDEGDINDWETMIDTNVKGLLYISRLVIPLMKEEGGGHIVNIGSTAGKSVYPGGNIYCATKSAVDALSKAMRMELAPHRIKVTAVHPGAAETEFSFVRFKGNEKRAKEVYEGYVPLHAEDVAGVVYFCVTQPPHVCINELILTPAAQASSGPQRKEH
jgi:NADP-dependent 3-hydroxy acid dehydrogenase YdfG